MPWKDAYTISDEKSLADADVHWPEGKRCAVHIAVDLSVASGPEGIGARDLRSAPAEFDYVVLHPIPNPPSPDEGESGYTARMAREVLPRVREALLLPLP